MWKNSKLRSQFAATLRRWAEGRSLLGYADGVVLGVSIVLFTTTRRPRRLRVVPVTCLAKSRNGPKNITMFVALD